MDYERRNEQGGRRTEEGKRRKTEGQVAVLVAAKLDALKQLKEKTILKVFLITKL